MSINLDAALIKKLSTMTLRARYVAEGYITGLHQSPLKGSSIDFAQHRQYVPGDELKYVDWKVYGRTDRFYVKQFQEETNLRAYCIIDTSSSMGYTSKDVTKLEYAAYLSAALTYLMIKQRDSVGLITYRDKVDFFVPPRNFKGHLQYLIDKLDTLKPEGKTDFISSFNEIGKRIKRRSLLILFSDLLEDAQNLIKSLKVFPYHKNDLIVMQILDPEELELKLSGEIEYIDPETGSALKTRPDVIRKAYKNRLNSFLKEIEFSLKQHNVDYYLINTDMTLDKALTKLMKGRKRIIA